MTKAERLNRLMTWIDLRLSGHSYESIAQQFDVRRQTVFEQVTNELRKRADQSVDAYRNELINQHDVIIEAMTIKAKQGDAQAAAQVLRALTQKAQLLGANAVQTSRLEISKTDGSIDEQIAELVAELSSNDAHSSTPITPQASDQHVKESGQ